MSIVRQVAQLAGPPQFRFGSPPGGLACEVPFTGTFPIRIGSQPLTMHQWTSWRRLHMPSRPSIRALRIATSRAVPREAVDKG